MIHLSKTSKMPCKSWSLNAGKTCLGSFKRDGKTLVEVCAGCYALGGTYNFSNVKAPRDENQEGWKLDSWVDEMVSLLDTERYFRWFDSGDLYHIRLAEKIYEVMKATPWCKHWLPTRMHKFSKFREIIEKMQALPNVVVRLSADDIDQVINGATTSMVISTDEDVPTYASLCEAYKREGKCGSCRACWDKDVSVIAYLGHGTRMNSIIKKRVATTQD